MQKLKQALIPRLPAIVLALIVIQPPLDVLSYFLSLRENNAPSTLLRFGLLALTALLGFVLSGRKRVYFALYGVTAAYWLAHVLNCYRIGYTSVVADTGNLLRTMNFPILALTFITILKQDPGLRKWLYLGTAIAFGEVILFTAIPWLSGNPVYTYYDIEVGVLGWFATPSAQSAIILLSVPLALYWAYDTGRYWAFLLALPLCFGMMYLIGTKMAFYSIFIITGGFVFLFVVQKGKKCLKYALPLVCLAALVMVFRQQSPMYVREAMSAWTRSNYQEMMADSLENSGADSSIQQMIGGATPDPAATPTPVLPPDRSLERVRRALMGIYANNGVYHAMTMNLNVRFGVYNTMDAYDYTNIPGMLSDTRQRKLNFSRMMWKEKDALTHFLGFEYSDYFFGILIHDLENDFPALFYSNGYIGLTLYLCFLGFFFYWILRGFLGDMSRGLGEERAKGGNRAAAAVRGVWNGLKRFMSIEMGAVGMSFLLAIIAAQISGSVLRRPNVAIYFAIGAAAVYSLAAEKEGPKFKPGKKEKQGTVERSESF